METIIGLLFILLPLVLKLINRKFEKAGQTDKARQFKEIAEMLGDDDSKEGGMIFNWPALEDDEQEPVVEKAPEMSQAQLFEAKATPVVRKPDVVKRKKPILEEGDSQKKHEKIDPKKLIVYSEIMNRKF